MPTMRELGLDRLTAQQCLALAGELYESFPQNESALTVGQRADLARRLAEYDADPSAGSGVDEVRVRLLGHRS